MSFLSVLLSVVVVASPQTKDSFVTGPDTLGKERQEFYKAISAQISSNIKARTNVKAGDTLGIDWRKNDDGGAGEMFIFPAGHSDRLYVTGINPGWNAEQDVNYNSMTCFARVNGQYVTVWTVDWRDPQLAIRSKNGPGLSKFMEIDAGRIDNKYIRDEVVRVRPYAVYRKGDNDSPWYSEFYDEPGNRAASRADDAGKSAHTFNTLVQEQDFLTQHP